MKPGNFIYSRGAIIIHRVKILQRKKNKIEQLVYQLIKIIFNGNEDLY